MWRTLKGFAIALAAAMPLALAPGTQGEAATKQRPAGSGLTTCEFDSLDGGADADCEGALCWCCYTDGCWICDNLSAPGSANCTWDPAYRVRQVRPGATGSGGVLETTPRPMTRQPSVTITPGRTLDATPGPTLNIQRQRIRPDAGTAPAD